MNTIPMGGPTRRAGMPAWLIAILGCCGGCVLIFGLLMAFGAGAIFAPKTPPPPAYVGLWTSADNTTLAIGADGTASYRSKHSGQYGNSSASVSGGRVKIDEAKHTLAIKIAGIGETWRIDSPPASSSDTTQMTLNGIVFKQEAKSSNGMLTDSGASGSQ